MFGHLTYLVFELGWGLPVLALHWLVGRRVLWPRRGVIALAAGIPTAYLSRADALAIHVGIWSIHADRIVGARVGDLPIEEIIFFLITNLMVVQTVILLKALR